MRNCEHAVTNADIFVEDLSRQLNILDGDNIYSIMASEENIDHLMEMLETSIKVGQQNRKKCLVFSHRMRRPCNITNDFRRFKIDEFYARILITKFDM